MGLLECVRFKYLMDLSTSDERKQFIVKLFDQNQDFLTAAVFDKLMVTDACEAKSINQIISNILGKRKLGVTNGTQSTNDATMAQSSDSSPTTNNRDDDADAGGEDNGGPLAMASFDHLSKPIIGLIGANLQRVAYRNLSVCNRSIYIACNDPNQLRLIDLTRLYRKKYDYSKIDLQQFTSLTSLAVRLKYMSDFPHIAAQQTVLNRLESVTLDANDCNEDDVAEFVANNYINFRNVKKLSLHHCFDEPDDAYDDYLNWIDNPDFLGEILSQFTALQYLHLFYVDTAFDSGLVLDNLNELKGLSVCFDTWLSQHQDSISDMLLAYGRNLEFLALEGDSDPAYDAMACFEDTSDLNLSELKQLKLCGMVEKGTMDVILRTAAQLSKLSISGLYTDDIPQIIDTIFASCKLLNFLEIGHHWLRDSNAILKGIEEALRKTTATRTSLKMKVTICERFGEQFKNIFWKIGEIMNALQSADCMFILRIDDICHGKSDLKDRKMSDCQILSELQASCNGYFVWKHSSSFVVQSADSKLNPYIESWIMSD